MKYLELQDFSSARQLQPTVADGWAQKIQITCVPDMSLSFTLPHIPCFMAPSLTNKQRHQRIAAQHILMFL
ncbi:hypothetical protein AOLI_G00032870 [Acnodon oligacanthus]